MLSIKEYYNEKELKSLTYLEFGAIDLEKGSKHVYDFRVHDEAYDFLMLARYAKDLISFKNMNKSTASLTEKLRDYEKLVHTKDLYNSFNKLASLNILQKKYPGDKLSFAELGGTLMGCIEALDFLILEGNRIESGFSTLDTKNNVEYISIDISKLLNDMAIELHHGYDLKTLLHKSEFTQSVDLFFAKGVSILYAIDTVPELVDVFSRAKVCNFDYSFSLKEQHKIFIGSGKAVTYFNFQEFVKEAKKTLSSSDLFFQESSIFMDEKNQRVRFNGYFGDKELIREVIKEELKLKEIFYKAILGSPEAGLLSWNHEPISIEDDFIDAETFSKKYL
jgi:hypothetical protein